MSVICHLINMSRVEISVKPKELTSAFTKAALETGKQLHWTKMV